VFLVENKKEKRRESMTQHTATERKKEKERKRKESKKERDKKIQAATVSTNRSVQQRSFPTRAVSRRDTRRCSTAPPSLHTRRTVPAAAFFTPSALPPA
jgi:AAA15 family ATPase/GTPase